MDKSTELAQVNAKNRQLYETLISHQTFLESFSDKMAVFGNLKNFKEELENEKSKNAQLVSELENLRSRNDQERQEIKGLNLQIYNLQEEFRRVTVDLETEKQEKGAAKKEYEKLIQEHESLISQIDDMEYEVRSCRDKLSYVADLKNQVQELNKFIKDLQDENLILRKTIDKNSNMNYEISIPNPTSGNESILVFEESPKLYGDPEKPCSMPNSPQKSEFFTKGLNARVVRNGHAGVTPKRFEATPKIPSLRMTTSRAVDSIHSWIKMDEPGIKSDTPTFLIDEAEKAKLTLAEFTNYIHDLEIS